MLENFDEGKVMNLMDLGQIAKVKLSNVYLQL